MNGMATSENKKSITIAMKCFVLFFVSTWLHGCGTVVKNPTRPKPTPSQAGKLTDVMSGLVAEVLELLNAGEASVKTSQEKVGFTCDEDSEGASVAFLGKNVKTKALAFPSGTETFTLDDQQEHNHRWSLLEGGVNKPSCAPDLGLLQTVLDLAGSKLSYEFKQKTTVSSSEEATVTEASGTRSLSFTEGEASESLKNYTLDIKSKTSRSIGGTLTEYSLESGTGKFSYDKSQSLWSEKMFNGSFTATTENNLQELKVESLIVKRGTGELCFPVDGKVTGQLPSTDNTFYNFTVVFAENSAPQLTIEGLEDEFRLKVLNCIN